ncbi:hypothetical protein [Kamptonema sp. UHCC 0994]|nr:hypothetical protein [Kamptonema sp. UHCC 0994]MDF0556897.1 hypothetical protein [Kamptonema sp. UHCC 0994]
MARAVPSIGMIFMRSPAGKCQGPRSHSPSSTANGSLARME